MNYTPLFHKRSILYLGNDSEKIYFQFLLDNFKHRYLIVPQVHILNLIYPAHKYISNNQVLDIAGFKSIDFVLYDRHTYKPLLCIEVNGGYHNEENRKKLDTRKKQLLQSAGLKVLAVEARENYTHGDRVVIEEMLGN